MGTKIYSSLPNFYKFWDCIRFSSLSQVVDTHNIQPISHLIHKKEHSLSEPQFLVQIEDQLICGKKLYSGTE